MGQGSKWDSVAWVACYGVAWDSVWGGESPRTESLWPLPARLRPVGCIPYQRPQLLAGLLLKSHHSLCVPFIVVSSFLSVSPQLSNCPQLPISSLQRPWLMHFLVAICWAYNRKKDNAVPKLQNFSLFFNFFLLFKFSCLHFPPTILPQPQAFPLPTLDLTPVWLCPCILYRCSWKPFPCFPPIIPSHLQNFFLLPLAWFSENWEYLCHSTVYSASLRKTKELPE